jgi:DNA-binding MarR family transcriptional regulator
MDKSKKLFELIELFTKIVSKFSFIENLIMDFTKLNLRLYKSEVHMIKYIKDNPEANVTELAKILGVTKGAVSQVLTKLVKKKLILKTNKGKNDKEIMLKLTKLGEIIYEEHEKLHKYAFDDFYKLINKLPDKNILFVENLFHMIDDHYDKIIKDKRFENNIFKIY